MSQNHSPENTHSKLLEDKPAAMLCLVVFTIQTTVVNTMMLLDLLRQGKQ